MPGIRSSITQPSRSVPLNGFYPKLLQGASGSVWFVTAPKTGTIVNLSARPQKPKHKVGYSTHRLDESKMSVFNGEVKLSIAA